MPPSLRTFFLLGRFGRGLVAAGLAAIAVICGTSGTQTADANGETRSLTIYHTHTKETATITFKRNGVYDRDGLKQLNWILRDWRVEEPTDMDPRLFDTVWQVYREVGSQEPIHIVSAYRSPKTNAMLRSRSRAVAEHSQHMLGKAMDFYLPDADMAKVRAIGMRLQRGGVGYYPNSYNVFVHLDVGSVRAWPRMTREQLARLFPDGKTVHMPTDNRPMPGYDVARAEVLANGGTVAGERGSGEAGETLVASGPSFWQRLFGGGSDESEDAAETVVARSRGAPVQTASLAGPTFGGDDSRSFFSQQNMRNAAAGMSPAPARTRPQPAEPVQTAQAPDVAPASPASAPAAAPVPKFAAADVPMPQARPAELSPVMTAGGGTRVASADPAAGLPRLAWQAGPDGLGAGASVPTAIPLPPTRPAEFTSLTGPATVLGYAPIDVPLPTGRPRSLVQLTENLMPVDVASRPDPLRTASLGPAVVMPATITPSPAAISSDARAELEGLFAAAATAIPQATTKVAVARARPTTSAIPVVSVTKPSGIVVVSHFGAPFDLASDRFTGPAVRPLPTTVFVRN